MKQDIENIIRKNFPEKKEHDWSKDEHTKTCKDGCTYYCNADGMITGFNQAISKTPVSLITDEVLKVVVEVANNLHDNFEKQDYSDAEYKANFLSELRLQLLTNSSILEGEQSEHLSPNKENKNNENK